VKAYQLSMVFCSLFVVHTAVFAQASPSETSLTANPVFENNCGKCHGKTGEGHRFGGPSLRSKKIAAASTEELHTFITNGKGHIPMFRMPKFAGKLSSQDIDTLVQQIQALNRK
jgi:mono/diheme cytochrome c family protein